MSGKNLILPGNPRYQPKGMREFFGYDNLYRYVALVEFATIKALYKKGVIQEKDFNLLTPEIKKSVMDIPTNDIEKIEREVTKHDIRAWVYAVKELLPEPLRRWVHVPLTSYDPIETGRVIQFQQAFEKSLAPSIIEVISILANKIEEFADTVQIGRTHGQHALPITVGFWFATILNRIISNYKEMYYFSQGLVGKISGAVGAHNAQIGLGFSEKDMASFEEIVLEELGLKLAPISTQILPPEPLTYFLFSCFMMTGSFGQLGRDCRHLMRTEIGEIQEEFVKGQVGSSTMAHKRNPINFENLEGMHLRTKSEFGKVMDSLVSEHQRDLVGSSLARDFPIILVNLQKQLDTLTGKKSGVSFLERIRVNKEACAKNLDMSINVIMAEPLYIALQMAGYKGDAHHFVNHELMPIVQSGSSMDLIHALVQKNIKDEEVMHCFQNIPEDIQKQLSNPKDYIGDSVEKSLEVVELARETIAQSKRLS